MSDPRAASSASSTDHVRFNATVNILDGAFFGFALGFASFSTIIPLFVSQLTQSAVLIGMAGAIHTIGWQVPQLFTAGRVQRLSRYKPLTLAMTLHERLPFLGLALLAWYLPGMDRNLAVVLVFALLIWQGFGGGFTANVWQSLIAKIIPVAWRGRFFGAQMAGVNLLASATAVAAGWILDRYPSPLDFTLCFALASGGMLISFVFLTLTRERPHPPANPNSSRKVFWSEARRILTTDSKFQRFFTIRVIFQLAMVAFSFYAVYAVNELGLSATLVGWLTGLMIFSMVILNPVFGMMGDRKGHWWVLMLGTLAALVSTALAGWFVGLSAWFLIFVLAGIANVVAWTTTMVITLEFGQGSDQATYIGLANTLLAPATLIAPLLAGWCISNYGYMTMFRVSAILFGIAAMLSFNLVRRDEKTPVEPTPRPS